MNWLNIYTPTLRSPDFIGSDPVARATWLYVMAYCCEQENGGRIVGARQWKDRRWQQACGVTAEEVETCALLMRWDGDDLILAAYPEAKEKEIKAKRVAGKKGGKLRAKAAKEAEVEAPPQITASSRDSSTASSCASNRDSTEGEGEGERKENRKKNSVGGLFDSFWSAYPRKVAKAEARKAFTKITVPLETILSAITEARKSPDWTKDGGRFIPYPASWLNGKRWEDESSVPLQPEARSSIVYTEDAFKTPMQILAERKLIEEQEEEAASTPH